ncbi:MAG: zinc-ribbon domain-containing protein [Erysipelotrichaceae bacterium]
MSENQTIRIPKESIIQAGNELGIKPNRLAVYFGLEEGKGKVKPEETWRSVLPVVLRPRNFSGVKVLFQDDNLLFTNILRNENEAVFFGIENEDVMVLPMESDEILVLLSSYLGEIEPTPRIKQELSLDALIAMLAIVDSVRHAKLMNVLDPSKTEFDLDLASLSKEFKDSVVAKDIRWLAPFMHDLRWEAKEINFDVALRELAKLGIVQYKNEKIGIDDRGIVLFDELLNRKTMLGIRSVFYHEEKLNYSSMAFIRSENYIWQLDGSEKSCMMTLNNEELQGMIAVMLSPGENPPEERRVSMEKGKDREDSSNPLFCRNCGEKLSIGARFCKRCGTKVN